MSLSVRTLSPSPDGHLRQCISEIAIFSMWKICHYAKYSNIMPCTKALVSPIVQYNWYHLYLGCRHDSWNSVVTPQLPLLSFSEGRKLHYQRVHDILLETSQMNKYAYHVFNLHMLNCSASEAATNTVTNVNKSGENRQTYNDTKGNVK